MPLQSDEKTQNSSKKIWLITAIVITAVITGSGVYAWQKSCFKNRELTLQQQIISLQNQIHKIQLNEADLYFDSCYWQNHSPIDFINDLKTNPSSPVTMFPDPPKDWIKKEHLKELIQLINSKEPASPVVSPLSSYYPFDETNFKEGQIATTIISTVGNEAMFLIEGYRKGKYPPELCSVYYFKPDSEEIMKWWEQQK